MPRHYSTLSDKDWLETIVASLSDASLGLPGFPSPEIQAHFIGRSGRPALEEAFEFYSLVKSSVPSLTGPILDFGCGWGRILRFFLKDLDQKYIHGVDVDSSAIAECRDTKVPGDIQLIAQHGPLPFSNDTFQIVYAYSVFTHLPEQVAAHWMGEIKRVLKPEGRIVFTALTAQYLKLCIEYQNFPPSTWQRQMADYFPNPQHLLARYEAGEFIYMPTGGGSVLTSDIYGWAAVPPNIMRDVWGLRIEQAYEDGIRFVQGAFIASPLRTSAPAHAPRCRLPSMAPGIDPFVDTRKPKNGSDPGEKVAMLAVNKQIDPRDHMFNSGPDWYWGVGESGLLAVRRVLGLTYTTSVRRILDLPSGHGRVGRYLRAGFPDAEIFFCDIDVHGAQFCAETFRGIAIPSRLELTEVDLPRDCDVIWVGSLFTHVDRDRTKQWLAHLCSRLSTRGVLVATFHGSWAIKVHEKEPMIAPEAWAAVLEGYKATGFGYAPYPEMTENYGISLSRPSEIVAMVEDIPGVRLLSYTERGWADNHDVLGVSGADRLTPW